ncbi:uncharacterized protein J4E88_002083 [Alternaria novae-zelandiae]|uniref:uncharacterized protein n=1 Tax=Alternaria novae-zelandiae TaxID=430562 RepID=UPI0020C468EF|nr:uncharacterized protein J4E88_002083 [Alternaria novae-zelandiae]KAI4690611.1 hypothetical protein J4E88_002083 [Alternaria novae-zelandiae]
MAASKPLAGRNLSDYNKTLNSSSALILPDIRDREVAVMNREMEAEEQLREIERREGVVEGRESAVERREREVEERERLLERREAKMAKKRKDGRVLDTRGKRMEEGMGRR